MVVIHLILGGGLLGDDIPGHGFVQSILVAVPPVGLKGAKAGTVQHHTGTTDAPTTLGDGHGGGHSLRGNAINGNGALLQIGHAVIIVIQHKRDGDGFLGNHIVHGVGYTVFGVGHGNSSQRLGSGFFLYGSTDHLHGAVLVVIHKVVLANVTDQLGIGTNLSLSQHKGLDVVSSRMPAGIEVIPALAQVHQQPVVTGSAAHTLQIHSGNTNALQQRLGTGKVVEAIAASVGKAIIGTLQPVRLVGRSGVLDVLEHILVDLVRLLTKGHFVVDDLGQDLVAHLVHHLTGHHIGHLRLGRLGAHRLFGLGDGDLNGHFGAVAAAVDGRIGHSILTGFGQIHLTGINLELNHSVHIIGDGHTLTVGHAAALHHFHVLGALNHRSLGVGRRFGRGFGGGLLRGRGRRFGRRSLAHLRSFIRLRRLAHCGILGHRRGIRHIRRGTCRTAASRQTGQHDRTQEQTYNGTKSGFQCRLHHIFSSFRFWQCPRILPNLSWFSGQMGTYPQFSRHSNTHLNKKKALSTV